MLSSHCTLGNFGGAHVRCGFIGDRELHLNSYSEALDVASAQPSRHRTSQALGFS